MIGRRLARAALLRDDGEKLVAHRVHHRVILEDLREHDDAGAFEQHMRPFRHQFGARGGIGGGGADGGAVVDRHVACNAGGEGDVGRRSLARDEALEGFEIAGVRRQPGFARTSGDGGVVAHGASFPDLGRTIIPIERQTEGL